MNIAELLSALGPLCMSPEANQDAIAELLDSGKALAEYEVARFMVHSAVGASIDPQLRSPDPRARRRAVELVRLLYPRRAAAQVLRSMVKDPDSRTRAHARFAVHDLGLDDVALPDTRAEIPEWVRRVTPQTIGAWNPTGWAYGTMVWHRQPPRSRALPSLAMPALAGEDDVAALVGLASASELTALLRPGTGKGAPYVEFEIPKATGGSRRIAAPRQRLKRVQQAILHKILAKIPAHEACHGFEVQRSTVTNARPHLGAAVIFKTDLRDFFPSVHYRRVLGLFEHYGYSSTVASLLAGLTTHRPVLSGGVIAWPGVLPQGAPTSPAIANLVCRRMDERLSGLAASFGAVYTRYADDLTFSFAQEPKNEHLGRFAWWVDQICQQEGFTEHVRKRRVLRKSGQQRVTGIVVNEGLSVPRAARRRFRAILANCKKHGVASQARGRSDFADYLRGFAAYVQMVQPALGAKWTAEVAALLAQDRDSAGSGKEAP